MQLKCGWEDAVILPQFANLVFFERSGRDRPEPRLRISESEFPGIVVCASQTRRRMERAIGVLEEMTACAQSGHEPSKSLSVAVEKVAADLHGIVASMDALERALREREKDSRGRDEVTPRPVGK